MSDQSPSPRALGAALREQRQRAGTSIRTLAKNVGLSFQYVAQLEQGERSPTLETTIKIATALGVAPGDLLDQAQIVDENWSSAPRAASASMLGTSHAMNYAPPSPGVLGGAASFGGPQVSGSVEGTYAASALTEEALVAMVRALPEGSRAIAARKLSRLSARKDPR